MSNTKISSNFPDRRVAILNNILDAVGQTPLVRLNCIPKAHDVECEVLVKCEFFNPGGSIKDRIARQMFLDAQTSGRIKSGDMIVEATSGNTGIGMSLVAAVMGYDMTICMPTKMSHEKQVTIEGLSAKVIRTPMVPSEHPDSLISVAKRLEKENGYILLDQYNNESNPKAHYEGTGQEIYEQCQGKLDALCVTCGTGGTMTGCAHRLKELLPGVNVIGIDPYGSILADPSKPIEDITYQVEGIGYDFVPKSCERNYVDTWIKIGDQESFDIARELMAKEGILAGGSSGSALAGALKYARDHKLGKDKRIVVILPDGIRNYMTKFIDPNWMIEKGFAKGKVERKTYDNLLKEKDELAKKVEELEKKLQAK